MMTHSGILYASQICLTSLCIAITECHSEVKCHFGMSNRIILISTVEFVNESTEIYRNNGFRFVNSKYRASLPECDRNIFFKLSCVIVGKCSAL